MYFNIGDNMGSVINVLVFYFVVVIVITPITKWFMNKFNLGFWFAFIEGWILFLILVLVVVFY